MASNSSRNAFLIHLGAYAAVNAVLLGLNAWQAPEPGQAREWWALWPLIGWGIGVLAHGVAVWMESRSNEGSLLADPDARGVAVHLFVYLAVNAFLIAVNLAKSPDSIWAIWPILGWGVGLAAHAWLAYRKILRRTMERYATEQQILAQIQLEQQAAAIAEQIAAEQEPGKKRTPAKRRRKTAAKTPKKKTARKAQAKTAAKPRAAAKRKPKKGKKPATRTSK